MDSPTKKRSGDDYSYERRGKRQATTPPRLTRAMLKKLNENGGPPVELNPGLEMGIRRRVPRTRPPKRAAQDEAVGGSVKRTATTLGRGSGAEPQRKEPEPKGSQLKEPQAVEHIPTEPQLTEPPATEPQPTETQSIQVPPTHHEKRVSEADVVAASRLAQAAIAAGLAGTTSEGGSPVVEDLPSLVRFTKEDLRVVLRENVVEDKIRRMMEPHWLARMEFLTWLERPAADMQRIKSEIGRLAVRWSRDLRDQESPGVDIPISMLESWRADITIVDDPGEDADNSESRNEGEKTGDEKTGDENEEAEKERDNKDNKETRTAGNETEMGEKEEDEGVLGHDSREVIDALAESIALAAQDMVEWKEAFDKEVTAEPNFRSKRAWTARVSESQRELQMLEKKVWNLDALKSEKITNSAMQAADHALDELQKFRIGLQMDREAFWDDFDQEGAEGLLGKIEIDQSAEEDIQEAVMEDESRDLVSEDMEIQITDSEAEVEDAQMTESEEFQGPNTSNKTVSGVKPDPTEQLSGATNDDNDSKPKAVGPEEPSVQKITQEEFPSVQREEPTPPPPSRIADIKSEDDVPKAQERGPRRLVETYAGKGAISPQKEEKSVAHSAAEFDQQDRESGAAEAGEKLSPREPTPWLPDKRGSHSPSWKWPPGEQQEAKVNEHEIACAVEEDDGPPHEFGRDTSSALFSSRSASAEEVSKEEEHRPDHDLHTSDMGGVPQYPSSTISSVQPQDIDGGNVKAEDTADQTLTTSDPIPVQQDTSSTAPISWSVSLDIVIGEAQNTADGSSSASNISSLPEDSSSSSSGWSETGGDFEVEGRVDLAPAGPSVPQETSSSQEVEPSTAGVHMESAEGDGGGAEDTVATPSSTSNIARLLEEVSLPQDTSSSPTSIPSGGVEEISGEPEEEEEAVHQTSSTNPPQATSPTASGIRSGSETGASGEEVNTIDDHAATTLDAAGLPQGSSAGEDMDAPPAVSVGESSTVIPNVRYIKPQWESLFSPEEPTYSANDYSANEIDEQDDDLDELDDREADDIDP